MNIEELREFCLSLPHATEDIKWGHDLCFCIGGKMFCITGLEPPLQVSLKVKDEEFDDLSSSEAIMPAPYVARYKWVLVKEAGRFSRKEWEHYIRQSYELVKGKLAGKEIAALGTGRKSTIPKKKKKDLPARNKKRTAAKTGKALGKVRKRKK
jgi:predicted DNA-binding protein (MmcQ/YjbR family)